MTNETLVERIRGEQGRTFTEDRTMQTGVNRSRGKPGRVF